MIQIDMGDGEPCVSIVLDEHNVVLMAAPVVDFMLEWSRERVLLYAEYVGWKVTEIKDHA